MQIATVTAQPLTEENLQEALAYCDRYLGQGLYDEGLLLSISRKPHHYFYLLSQAGESIGIFYCYAAKKEEVEKAVHASLPGNDAYVGLNRSIALSPAVRGQCLSDELLSFFSGMLHEKEGICSIYTLAWIRDGFIPAAGHLARCGYRYVLRVPHPWQETEGLLCPACKQSHCICDGALYALRFDA